MSGHTGRRQVLLRWLPALAWMGVIFLLSSQSGLRVTDDATVDRPIRSLAHMASYALLAGLLLYALSGWQRASLRSLGLALGIAFVYALSDEWHQSLVPDRTGRMADVWVDLVGAIVGLALAAPILASVGRRRGAVQPRA